MIYLFVNDKVEYIYRYRRNVIDYCVENEIDIEKYQSIYKLFFRKIILLYLGKPAVVISSNLRSNLKVLIFYAWRCKIIVNGLGRYRSTFVRKLVGFLMSYRNNADFYIQNYADFRYFRRYFRPNVVWMPGSGGVRRVKKQSGYFIVTRDQKFLLIKHSLGNFLKLKNLKMLNIIGLKNTIPSDARLNSIGYVDQDKIFSFGDVLIVPRGYGEGIPHVLVDALASDLTVWLEYKDYIGFGLYNKAAKVEKLGGWVKIDASKNSALVELTSASQINMILFPK